MKCERDFIVNEIAALEEALRASGLIDIASTLRAARRAVIEELPSSELVISDAYQVREINWFERVIDQLTRIAYENDLTEVENHLVSAREAWDAQRSRLSVNVCEGSAKPH